jgi:hypothetical protein
VRIRFAQPVKITITATDFGLPASDRLLSVKRAPQSAGTPEADRRLSMPFAETHFRALTISGPINVSQIMQTAGLKRAW